MFSFETSGSASANSVRSLSALPLVPASNLSPLWTMSFTAPRPARTVSDCRVSSPGTILPVSQILLSLRISNESCTSIWDIGDCDHCRQTTNAIPRTEPAIKAVARTALALRFGNGSFFKRVILHHNYRRPDLCSFHGCLSEIRTAARRQLADGRHGGFVVLAMHADRLQG